MSVRLQSSQKQWRRRDRAEGLTPGVGQVGDTSAEACEGEFCVIPPHHDQHVMNRRVDSDNV